MSKKTISITFFIIIGLGFLSNFFLIIFNDVSGIWIYLVNIIFFLSLLIISFLLIRIDRVERINKNNLIDINQNLEQKALSYEETIKEALALISVIENKINERENPNDSKEQLTKLNNEKLKEPEIYKETLDRLIEKINTKELEIIKNYITKHIRDIILDVYVKIPYLNRLIDGIRSKTEEVIHSLIDKFNDVSESNSQASREAEKNIMFLKNIYGGKDFGEVAKDSKEAYNKTKDIINRLILFNKENRKKLDKIEMWIKQINNMLNNIQDIAEQNKTIAINSSIEAARIGEAGKGFRVLVQEIQQLNQKTSNFTTEINGIMTSFEKYNETMINEWDKETMQIVDYMEKMIEREEKRINKFIESFELTIKSFQDLNNSTKEVEENLNQILSSLQYEDITGQQIRHIKEFLGDIHDEIKNKDYALEDFEINLNNISKDLDQKIRETLLKRVTVLEEKNILDESIM
jgi:methyl-accepting chemotaxis protein